MLKLWVIKAGGDLMASARTRKKILNDLAKWQRKNPVIFVHGGGPQIEAELIRNKVPVKFIGGRRFTSTAAMIIVERVLSGQVNKAVTAELNSKKILAVGLSGRDGGILMARPLPNLGLAGTPIKVNPRLLFSLLQSGFVPILSSVASDKKGNALNINADDFAGALARSMKASHLIYLTDIAGVRDQSKKKIPILKISKIDELIKNKTITGGMIPKVQSARDAILKGVGEINIVDGHQGINLSAGTRICK